MDMTTKRIQTCALAILTLWTCAAAATGGDPLKPFPEAAEGQVRYVIQLQARPDESSHQAELLVGKTIEVDCNRYSFMGRLERETVQGWGYDYYRATGLGPPAGTRMACPGQPPRSVFVALGGGPHWVRYNSALPVVVYVPEGFQVRYRLWSAAGPALEAEPR